MTDTRPGYQVLARKYRPTRFDDLIGQEPMVRTLRNAFAAGRIPHAWMLTGVRGVGKTTTARILARGLNYETEAGDGAPTVDLPAEGVHCRAIMEGRHPDVVEMDAASHTGIDDIRDLIDSARYAPVSARFKVYIVDEVHMLSKQAFNGLLKTLEEPPAHVKFLFATTEIRKVPVTILSRCQRFDLRRVEARELAAHLGRIAERESVGTEPEALRAIARAAEGSVRDALSILDQAIAHGAGAVAADTVAGMLGLSDRTRIVELFGHVMGGDTAAALAEMDEQRTAGADPLVVLNDLAEFTHYVTRLKLAPKAAADAAVSEAERVRGSEFAERLSVRVLSRAWQMLLKGLTEVGSAARPAAAADMLLVRLCHVADLPTPDEALRVLRDGSGRTAATGASRPAPAPPTPRAQPAPSPAMRGGGPAAATQRIERAPASMPDAMDVADPDPLPEPASRRAPEPARADRPAPQLASFADVIARARLERDVLLLNALERHVRPVRFEPGAVEIALDPQAAPDLPQRLGRALEGWTGRRWVVAISELPSTAETAREGRVRAAAETRREVEAHPLVREVLERFPGAEIVRISSIDAPEMTASEEDR